MEFNGFDIQAFATNGWERVADASSSDSRIERAETMSLQPDPFKGWGFDQSSSARAFAHSQNMMVTQKGVKTTHVFMAGGKMNLIETPANCYAFRVAAAQPNHLNTISEEAEEEFCAYLEIDPPDHWTPLHTDAFLPTICFLLTLFFPGVFFLVYLSTKESGAKGMHIVIPQLCVTRPRMLKVRRYAIVLLQRNLQFADIDDWEPIIDKKVYTAKQSHMRLNYSYKAEQHHACFRNGKFCANAPCSASPACKHGYFYKPGNFYRVERVYKSDGTRDLNEEMLVSGPHIESRVRQLEKTSIRHPTRVLTVPFVTPLDCPPEIDETKKSYSKFTLEHQIMKTIGEDTKKYTLDPKDPVFSAIVEFLHAHSRPEWKHIQVTDIKYKLTGKNNAFRKYFIYVNPKAPGGTCCLNRTPNEFGIRQHKSAPVYFTLTCQGLRQRCNAGAGKKNRVAVNGKIKPCTQFESNVMPMRPTILMRIFPPTSVPPSLHVSRAPSRSQSIVVAADALTRASSNSDNLGQTQNNSVCHEDSCVDVQKSVNALVLSDSVTAEVPSTLKPAEDSAPDPLQLAQQKDHEQKLKLLRWINATKLSSVKKSSSFTNKSQNMYGPIKRTFSDRKTMFNNSSDVRLEVASKFIADKLQVKTKSHPYVHPSERQSPTISATG